VGNNGAEQGRASQDHQGGYGGVEKHQLFEAAMERLVWR